MRVWVTRDESVEGPLSQALSDAGLTVVLEPVVRRHVVDDAADAIGRLGADDWLVLTSVYAIEVVAGEPAQVPRVAVVGAASCKAAKRRGLRVELVSSGGDSRSLFDALRARTAAGIVCYPRSSLTDPPDAWAGIELISPILYETVPLPFDRSVIERVDVVSVVSPSAVDAIRAAGLELSRRPVASLGPITSAALRRIGIEPWIEAPRRRFGALAQSIAAKRRT